MNYYKIDFGENEKCGIVSAESFTEATKIADAWVVEFNNKRKLNSEKRAANGHVYYYSTTRTLEIRNISVSYDLFMISS